MVEEISNSARSITLGRRNTLKSDAFKGKAIQIKNIKDKELKQFFGVMYRDQGKSGKDIGNMFIDEKEFEKIFTKLEQAAGGDSKLTKEELMENHYSETKASSRRLFNSLKKLAKNAPDVIEKNDDGSAKVIKEKETKRPRGEFKKEEGVAYTKEGKQLYKDTDIQVEGHPVTVRKHFKDGDEKQVAYEDMIMDGKVVSRSRRDENGNVVQMEIKDDNGATTTKSGTQTTVANPDGTTVKTTDMGNGVTKTVTTTVATDGGKTAVFEQGGEKHTVKYDKDGNTYVAVKHGESFAGTAARLGISEASDPEKFAQFRKLNENLIHKYGKNKVEAFQVGTEVRYPGTLEYNSDTAAILDLNAKSEEAKYAAKHGGKAGASGAATATTSANTEPVKEAAQKLNYSIPEGIDKSNENLKTLLDDVSELKSKEFKAQEGNGHIDYELTQEKLTVYRAPREDGKECIKEYEAEYKDGLRTKMTEFDEAGKPFTESQFKDGLRTSTIIFNDNGTKQSVTEFDKKDNPAKMTMFQGDQIEKVVEYKDGKKVSADLYKDGKIDVTEKYNEDGTISKMKHKTEVIGEEKLGKDGKVKTANSPEIAKLAEDLKAQISGISFNRNTNPLIAKINKDNVVEVLQAYKKDRKAPSLLQDISQEYNMWGGTKLKSADIIKALLEKADANGVSKADQYELYGYIADGNLKFDKDLDSLVDEIIGKITQ